MLLSQSLLHNEDRMLLQPLVTKAWLGSWRLTCTEGTWRKVYFYYIRTVHTWQGNHWLVRPGVSMTSTTMRGGIPTLVTDGKWDEAHASRDWTKWPAPSGCSDVTFHFILFSLPLNWSSPKNPHTGWKPQGLVDWLELSDCGERWASVVLQESNFPGRSVSSQCLLHTSLLT